MRVYAAEDDSGHSLTVDVDKPHWLPGRPRIDLAWLRQLVSAWLREVVVKP